MYTTLLILSLIVLCITNYLVWFKVPFTNYQKGYDDARKQWTQSIYCRIRHLGKHCPKEAEHFIQELISLEGH